MSDHIRTLLRIAWVVCLGLVITGSLLPAWSEPILLLEKTGLSDKVEHTLAYAALGFLPVLSEPRRRALLYLMCAGAVGVALEFLQRISPGRSFEVADMGADFLGVAAGSLVALALRWRAGAPESRSVSRP